MFNLHASVLPEMCTMEYNAFWPWRISFDFCTLRFFYQRTPFFHCTHAHQPLWRRSHPIHLFTLQLGLKRAQLKMMRFDQTASISIFRHHIFMTKPHHFLIVRLNRFGRNTSYHAQLFITKAYLFRLFMFIFLTKAQDLLFHAFPLLPKLIMVLSLVKNCAL